MGNGTEWGKGRRGWAVNSFGGVCMYVCMSVESVCNTITFESLDAESSFLIGGYVLRGYRSGSYMKVIRLRSRSKEQKTQNSLYRNVKFRPTITRFASVSFQRLCICGLYGDIQMLLAMKFARSVVFRLWRIEYLCHVTGSYHA